MNLEKICLDSCAIIKQTGDFLMRELGKVQEQNIEHKDLNHLVSYVDQEAEKQLVQGLNKILPQAAFLAEEGTTTYEDKTWRWIIDPLDGTTNFLHQLPFFSISVALQRAEETVLGIVYEANRRECFYSWKGAGSSFLNNSPIYCRKIEKLQDSLLATGFPYYDFEQTTAYLKMLERLMRETRGLRRLGSAALDLAYLACGRFDGYFEYSLSPWDVAAGAFLVQQAGGSVSDFSGTDNYLFGKEILAASPSIYPTLLNYTKTYFKGQ